GLSDARRALGNALKGTAFGDGELAALLSFAAGTLAAEDRDSPIREWNADGLPEPEAEVLPQWRALGEALLTKGGDFRRSVSIATGFPPKTPEKDRMAALLDALSDAPDAAELLHRARRMPAPAYDDEEWRVLEALVRVLERAAAELQLVFAETGRTDFTGLSAAALQGLGDEESGYTDLGLYLDRRIRHVLVDEYQDTNWAQFHLLEKLTHGWEPGDGRTLFVVGDPMQSIYRFREAEVGLFIRTRDEGLGDLAPDPLKLTRNFRSRAEIVEFVNDAIGPAFPDEEDVAAGAVRYAASEPARDAGGRVDCIARPDAASEAAAVAETVHAELEAHAEDPGFRAAIIVRARGHLAEILPALKARGVPFRAVKLDPLLQRPAVLDLLSLVRAILLPDDRTALAAVLRAPVAGLTLADLHCLLGDGRDPRADDATRALSPDGRERARRVLAALSDAHARIGRRSLRELVEGTWKRLGGPRSLARPDTELREAGRFLDTLEAADTEGLAEDLNDLVALLETAFTEGDPENEAVRLEILTMHGAKGLEWDLVVIPGLDRGSRGPDRELLYWLPFTPTAGAEEVLLAPLRAADQPGDPPLVALIRDEQKRRDAFEMQRLLYVAATRARTRLVLTARVDPEKPRPGSGSLLELLWPRVGPAFVDALGQPEAATTRPAAAARPEAPPQAIRRVPAGWNPPCGERLDWSPAIPPREHETEIEFHWAGQQARRTGTVLHRLLEHVGRTGIEDLTDEARRRLEDRVPQLLRALGTGPRTLEENTRIVREAFERTLDSDRGRWILSGAHRDAACELPLTGVVDGQLVQAVIDRTFVDENGTRWIIDWKSGHHAGGDLEGFLADEAERYRDQLTLYRRLFEQMGETDIRTALHFPRHGEMREVETRPRA
ncbi:MAG: 3'-5' exonuclease, partial [Wenzhouxiangellaceae bacterium]|nr:3'-5' exonuclease [Wenzhouxiangellaceae bacterium]